MKLILETENHIQNIVVTSNKIKDTKDLSNNVEKNDRIIEIMEIALKMIREVLK